MIFQAVTSESWVPRAGDPIAMIRRLPFEFSKYRTQPLCPLINTTNQYVHFSSVKKPVCENHLKNFLLDNMDPFKKLKKAPG